MKRLTRPVRAATCAASLLLLTACLQDDDGGGGGGGGSDAGDGVVEIFGAFGAAEAEAFEDSLAAFEEESGITVNYTGNADFATFIRSRVQGGSPPDIALFPQPGLLLDLAAGGDLVPIEDYLDRGQLEETLIPGFLDAATDADGTTWGAPMRMAVKSLVWVPQPEYADGGYSLEPASVQALNDIAAEIRGSGTAPWCVGFEDGAATGWVGTDWIEELVLRIGGPEVYDDWVSHEIPFNNETVLEAFAAFEDIALAQGNVRGGGTAIVSDSFRTAPNGMFEDPPRCMMHRQGNFVTTFFPQDVQANLGESIDLMIFPPWDGGYDGQPVLGGGDLAGLFNGDDEDAQQVMEFLTSDEFGAEWAAAGGWLSPHATFDGSNYVDDTTREVAELAAGADVFRFDGSDLMPAEVGAGTFWTGMVEFVTGQKTAEEVTQEIEASWPTG